jgi:serine/threonine protein kinase/tetratricopeptide (TPR) repeat protein
MVTPERWQQIKVVLDGALDREGAERAVFLDQACRGDEELRREVESFAASETEAGDFIETPVFRILLEEPEPLALGQRVGAYRIVSEIGRGGMGAVYLAERDDREFEQKVAIKLVRRGMDTEEIVRRFRSERQILAHLDHPNIAKLFDGGSTEDGRPYFVMELVEGRPIDQYCDERKLPVRARLELFRQVCAVIHFAHQNLIVHRDLKPGNILVTADGVPKLLDFGIAKLLDPSQDLYALTRVEQRPMTPEYASPEQVKGETITTASDVYSLGVLLYELLTGHRPYRPSPSDPQSLVRAICETDPIRPSSIVGRVESIQKRDGSIVEVTPEAISRVREGDEHQLRRRLSGDLDTIVLKAMQKDPQRRYASVDQLADDLGRHLQNLPVVARKDTLAYRTRKFVRRNKWGVGIAAAVFLLIAGFGIWVTVLWQQAVREQQRAQAVSTFLEELFSRSDPSKSHGEDVTVRQMLDQGARKINSGLESQPAVRADLMETMGRAYRSLGLYEEARPLLEGALRLNHNADALIVAQNLHNLAGERRDVGRYAEAEQLIRAALKIEEEHKATESLDYAKGLSNLAELLANRGEPGQAEDLLKRSLQIKRRLPDADESDIASSYNSLGKHYELLGNYNDAELNYQEALRIRVKLAGGRLDPAVATSIGSIGSVLEDRGDLAGAEKLYKQALEMRRKLYGYANPKLAPSLSNLGHVLLAEGKLSEAEASFREALSVGDPDPKHRGTFLRNLAETLLREAKAVEAESRAREALALFRDAKPAWRIADAESLLGACLAAQGHFKEAEPLLLESYSVLQKDKGGGAQRAAEARQRIEDFRKASGKPEKL